MAASSLAQLALLTKECLVEFLKMAEVSSNSTKNVLCETRRKVGRRDMTGGNRRNANNGSSPHLALENSVRRTNAREYFVHR